MPQSISPSCGRIGGIVGSIGVELWKFGTPNKITQMPIAACG
jgi:hypothetical protein